jgi:hypothetical protein
MYGSALTALLKMKEFLNPEKIIDTLTQPCTKCGTSLNTYIKQERDGIPDSSWVVAKCNNCNELNLISLKENIQRLQFGAYSLIETLNKEQYNREQALVRLEQIKVYRK